MRSLNRATIIGHLGKDAELTQTPNSSVVKFSIATTHRFKRGDEWTEETDWHNIVLWRGDNLVQYLTKGTSVYVEGRISNRSYEAKDGAKRYISEIVADQVILLGGGAAKSDQTAPAKRAPAQPIPFPQSAAPAPDGPVTDEDIPF